MKDHHPPEPLGPRRLDASLARLTRRLGGPTPDALQAVFSGWEDIVGRTLASRSRPVSLARRVLVVAVEDAAWGSELRYLAAGVLARLDEVVGPGTATRVEVRVRPPGDSRQVPPVVK